VLPKIQADWNCSNRNSKKRKDGGKYHQNSKHVIQVERPKSAAAKGRPLELEPMEI